MTTLETYQYRVTEDRLAKIEKEYSRLSKQLISEEKLLRAKKCKNKIETYRLVEAYKKRLTELDAERTNIYLTNQNNP